VPTPRVELERGTALAAALDALLAVEPDLPYANFAPLAARPGSAAAVHRERWLAAGAALVARGADGTPLAAARVDARPFESEHFGLPMAIVDRPLATADPSLRLAGLRMLLPAAVEHARERGFAHLAARASTRDRVTPWVLQELGAFHVDTQVSWMASLTGMPHDEHVAPPLRIEIRDRSAQVALPRAAWKRLAEWGGRAFDRGPLVFDHTLPHERALRVYEAWTERVMAGAWADAVLLAWDRDEIVAFISMLELPDVSRAAAAVVCGRGLGATLPEYRGLFTAIQREMITARPLGAAYMENETQVATIGSINVYARLGFRYLRSTATFHLRLDGARPACA
jgi:GNAT superfamily N-acetyltransferase